MWTTRWGTLFAILLFGLPACSVEVGSLGTPPPSPESPLLPPAPSSLEETMDAILDPRPTSLQPNTTAGA
jgi:hypothetical protein